MNAIEDTNVYNCFLINSKIVLSKHNFMLKFARIYVMLIAYLQQGGTRLWKIRNLK